MYKKISDLIKTSKNWFLPNVIYPNKVVHPKMVDRNMDDDNEAPSSKKLCMENELKLAPVDKIKFRKMALLLGYLGDNYFGMQVNTVFKTVERDLLLALNEAGVINPAGINEPRLIKLQRTARTDKGVSAVKQVVSLHMAEKFCLESVKKHLPTDIRLFSGKKVTKGFNCKNDCTARTYSYTLPTFALASELHTEYPDKYRVDEETIDKVNKILLSYVGTHNFHNFTVKKNFNDPSVKRYVMSVSTEEPFLKDEEEFITLKIKGQSFMFHQIRKMVGHMIAIIKGVAPTDIQTDIWKSTKYSVPLAPSIGLVLEDVHFEKYDKKFGNDGIHECLQWNELADEIRDFRAYVLSNLIKKEIEEKSMFNWLLCLACHSYDPKQNINPYSVTEENSSARKIQSPQESLACGH